MREAQMTAAGERPLVLSIHGIRTRGAWQKALTRTLNEGGFDHAPLDYGFFLAWQLLRRSSRRARVDWFRDAYAAEVKGRAAAPSIIAHSLGTYIVTEAMRIYPEVRFERVILCGSIVRTNFPWRELFARGIVQSVLNDFGHQDPWAAMVGWFVDDAGPSGVKGFEEESEGRLVQRAHPDWRHSDYFYELNFKDSWIPFLQGRSPGLDGVPAPTRVNWRSRIVRLAAVALLAMIAIVAVNRVTSGRPGRARPTDPPTAPPASVQPMDPKARHNPRDGLTYVRMPAGRFQVGCVEADAQCYDDEKPQHEAAAATDKWLTRSEVTVEAYLGFLRKRHRSPPVAPGFNEKWERRDHPMVAVSWDEARDYCAWAGGRLPTEEEWEGAARGGKENVEFPWGDHLPGCERGSPNGANFAGCSASTTMPVCSFVPNAYGLCDMAGNVAEWVDAPYGQYEPDEDQRSIARGGSWESVESHLRASYRNEGRGPDFNTGFRCLMDSAP